MMWSPDDYFNGLSAKANAERKYAFPANEPERLAEWSEGLKNELGKLIGFQEGLPAKEPANRILEEVDCGDYVRLRIAIEVDEGLSAPAFVLVPKSADGKAPLPAVIACHGHGYGSRDIVGLESDGSTRTGDPGYHKDFAIEIVRRGFVVVAPELIGFGDTRLADHLGARPEMYSCWRMATNLLMQGKTLIGLRVRQTRKAIDYLAARGDVDSARIGCMGISGGGMVASFAAALDERLKAVVVSGYVSTFQGSIMSINHCIDNYVPGLLNAAELPDIVSLIAPRPLVVEAGTKDDIFPIESVKEAYARISEAYALSDAEELLANDYFEGGHAISGAVAYDWLIKYLS